MSIKMEKIDSYFSAPHDSRLLDVETLVGERPFVHGNSTSSSLIETHRSLALGTVVAYASQIRASMGRSFFAVLDTAALVAEAKDALGNAGFRELAETLEQSPGTLSKYVTIHSRRDRFVDREEMLPSGWTVAYRLSKLSDQQFEAMVAAGKLQPRLSEREVKKFVAQLAAADDVTCAASDELAYLAVKVVFPVLLSEVSEDGIRRRIIAAVKDEAGVTVKFSERQKFKASRR